MIARDSAPAWLPGSVTPNFVQQADEVSALIAQGYTTGMIAHRMQLSSARVTQIRQQMKALAPELLQSPSTTDRLGDRRTELRDLRLRALHLARQLGRDLRTLDEELEAEMIDRQLGLRPS